jgi:hypothetical protein
MLYPIELRARSAHFWDRPIKLGEFGWEVNPFCRVPYCPGEIGPPSGEGFQGRATGITASQQNIWDGRNGNSGNGNSRNNEDGEGQRGQRELLF